MASVLIAQTDHIEATLLGRHLGRDHHTVRMVDNGRDLLRLVRHDRPDLVVLDTSLPGVGGFDVARTLRDERRTVPLVFFSAQCAEEDVLAGFDVGADDYVAKPCSLRELVARVRAVLRRTATYGARHPVTRLGQLEIDADHRCLRFDGRRIVVTPTEFDICAVLMQRPGVAWTRRQLIESTRGWNADCQERTIDVHIGNLRRKIEPDPAQPIHFLTANGHGYRMATERELRPA